MGFDAIEVITTGLAAYNRTDKFQRVYISHRVAAVQPLLYLTCSQAPSSVLHDHINTSPANTHNPHSQHSTSKRRANNTQNTKGYTHYFCPAPQPHPYVRNISPPTPLIHPPLSNLQRRNREPIPLGMPLLIRRTNLHTQRNIQPKLTAQARSSEALGSRMPRPGALLANMDRFAMIVLRIRGRGYRSLRLRCRCSGRRSEASIRAVCMCCRCCRCRSLSRRRRSRSPRRI
jgi:hypothetical protein